MKIELQIPTLSFGLPVLVVAFLLLSPTGALAASRFWTGGGAHPFWENGANWSNNVAPVGGDTLIFPAGGNRLTNTNRVSGQLTNLAGLRFTGDNYNVYSTPALSLTNGVVQAAFVGSANALNAGLQLRRNQTWTVASRTSLTLNSNVNWTGIFLTNDLDGTLVCNGNLIGAGGGLLVKTGPGRLELNGAGNQVTTMQVADGILNVSGALTTTASLAISNGATLSGTGRVSTFLCAGDFQPGGSGPGLITMTGAGSAVFQAGSRFVVNLNGLVPGAEHDQFKTPSPPSLSFAQLVVLRSLTFPFAVGQKFVIVTNTGATAQGTTFANLPANSRITNSGVVFQISYSGGTGNDVDLTVVEAPVAPTGVRRVWDAGGGAADRNWSTAANWDNNTLPAAGDDLIFPAAIPGTSGLRNLQNNLAPAQARVHRLWFGGQGNSWNLQGDSLKVLGGIVATNAAPAGEASFSTASVELLGPQTWGATNMGLTFSSPVFLGGHTLTLASSATDAVRLQSLVTGPGTLVAASGVISFFNQLGASNVAVSIQGGQVFAGFGSFSGPPWQQSGGRLNPSASVLPGLQMSGGTLEFSGAATATIAGPLTLAPGATLQLPLQMDRPGAPLLGAAGPVNLAGAHLSAGALDVSLLGATFILIEKSSPGAVTGTFAGLPEGGQLTATNNVDGLVTIYRISYVGGDGNDVTVTSIPPSPSGLARIWSGGGTDPAWTTPANWTGNLLPGSGDSVLFPENAARQANTNPVSSLVLDAVEWSGSNYVHSGAISLISGVRNGAAGGTNTIAAPFIVAYGEQTWSVSNAPATLRIRGEDAPRAGEFGSAGERLNSGLVGLGPVTKSGAGTLDLERLSVAVTGGLRVNGGSTRLRDVGFRKSSPLILQQGRLEAAGVEAPVVNATQGELVLSFYPLPPEEGGVGGGLLAFSSLALGSNAILTVHWTNQAPAAIQTLQVELDSPRLNLIVPPDLPAAEVVVIAQYPAGGRSGRFAHLPDGAVTNIAGRAWQIHYDVERPDVSVGRRFITLQTPAEAPRFTSLERRGNGDVVLRGVATAGATVMITASGSVDGFVFLGSVVANVTGQFTFLDAAGAVPLRFYRAELPEF